MDHRLLEQENDWQTSYSKSLMMYRSFKRQDNERNERWVQRCDCHPMWIVSWDCDSHMVVGSRCVSKTWSNIDRRLEDASLKKLFADQQSFHPSRSVHRSWVSDQLRDEGHNLHLLHSLSHRPLAETRMGQWARETRTHVPSFLSSLNESWATDSSLSTHQKKREWKERCSGTNLWPRTHSKN